MARIHAQHGGWMTFLEEMKRRRVFRALLAYGIGAFAVLQIVEPILCPVRSISSRRW